MHQIHLPNNVNEGLKSSVTFSDFFACCRGRFQRDFCPRPRWKRKCQDKIKIVEDICMEQDFRDIWRVSNPPEKRFTRRKKTPIIQRRLEFSLVNDCLQDDIVSGDITPCIKSDHSAITFSINGVDDSERDPIFWKFNCSLVNDNNYHDLLYRNNKIWREEFKDVVDKRVL